MEFDLRKFLTENRITQTPTPPESLDMSDVLHYFKKFLYQFYSNLDYWYQTDEDPDGTYSQDKNPLPNFSEWDQEGIDVDILEEIRTGREYREFFSSHPDSEDILDRYLQQIREWIQDPQFQRQATMVMDDLRDSLKDESGYDDPDQYDNWASSRGVRGGRMFEKAGEDIQESDYSDYLDTHYSSDGMDDYYSDKASQHMAGVLYTVGYELHKIGRTKEAESYRQQALDVFPEWTERDLPPY